MYRSDDIAWFKDISEQAVRENSDYVDKNALSKFFLAKITSAPSSSLNAQTCVFLAQWMAESMTLKSNVNKKDIETYGRIVHSMLNELEMNTTCLRMVPKWFVGLTEKCLQGEIESASDIVSVFKDHGAEYQLQYCKSHQGIPLVITNRAILRIHSTSPLKKAWTIVDSEILSDGVPRLKSEMIFHLTDNFIATTIDIAVRREKLNKKSVIVYRFIRQSKYSQIRHEPTICKYINLRLRLQSQYINPVLGIIDQDESTNSAPCLVMDDNTTTSLFQYLADTNAFKKYSSWTKKLRIARSIAAALKYLHDNGIVHKMLNPCTVLMTENLSVKLTCFGMNGEDYTAHASGVVAPEVTRSFGHSFASDVFDFGLILMELIGYRVHDEASLSGVLSVLSIASCPRWYEQMIRLCTMDDPNERLCVDDIVGELDKHLRDCSLDAPKDFVALMELDKTRVVQTSLAYSNDVVTVYDGKFGDKDVWIKRPNNALSNTAVYHLLNEVMISSRCESEHIVHVYGIIESNSTSPGVVIEKMNLGSLKDFISRIEDKNSFDDTSQLHIAISVAQALLDIHEMDYVHCHVHTQSVFLSSNNKVKLGNLILSQPADVLLSHHPLEHVYCLAPEVKAGHAFSKAADVYAFGKLLICLDLCKETSDEDVASSKWCQSLVALCCDEDAQKRPTMRKVIKLLKRLKQKASPSFLKVKLRGRISLSDQIRDLPAIMSDEIVYAGIFASGAFGTIQRGIYDSKDIAIKEFQDAYRYDASIAQGFAQEAISLHRCQSSQYIVSLFGICLKERQIVMELMDGDLGQFISQQSQHPADFTWEMRLNIALQMAKAIAAIHDVGVVHLNIKSLDFLYRQSGSGLVVKLCNFGESRLIEEWSNGKFLNSVADFGSVGKSQWKAPEVICGRVYEHQIAKVDIYSLGVVFNELDSLHFPMTNGNFTHTLFEYEKLVCAGELRPEFSWACPYEFKRIALDCLEYNPCRRPTAQEVVRRLEMLL